MSRSSFGSIDKRGRNVYRIRWTENDGSKRSETVHGTRQAAADRLAQIQLGMCAASRSDTVSSYWESTVLPSMSGLKPKTVADYKWTWEKYLMPAIGSVALSEVGWREVQSMVDSMPNRTAQRKSFVLMRKIMNMAARDRLCVTNPCDRSIRMDEKRPRQKSMVPTEDMSAWLESVMACKYFPIVLVSQGGGLRPEECYALDWDDVSFESGYAYVNVERTLVTVDGRPLLQDSVKTGYSAREVVVGEPFSSMLASVAAEGPLCPNGAGGRTSPGCVARNWKAWCDRNGVQHVTFADMRSNYATNLGEIGAPDSLVSMQMGHSDGTTKGANYQRFTRRGGELVADMYAEAVLDTSWTHLGH